MQELSARQIQSALDDLEELREEDALDPKVRSARNLFDLTAYYFVLWAAIGGAIYLAFHPIFWFSNIIGISPKAGTILLLLSALGIAIAVFWSFDSEAGKKRERWLKLQARIYVVPIAVIAAFYGGWYWRDHNPPDRYQAEAERAAWRACAQIPLCVERATTANFGNDVLQYIRETKAR